MLFHAANKNWTVKNNKMLKRFIKLSRAGEELSGDVIGCNWL
jgi:hypothetical protein